MKRLFVATSISNELKRELREYQQSIQHLPLRPTSIENLHLTLVFLGVTPEEKIPEIKEIIQKIISPLQGTYLRQGFGGQASYKLTPLILEAGPDPKFPRLIWLTLKASQEFLDFQKELAKALGREEGRPFTAHITIARLRPNSRLYSDQIKSKPVSKELSFKVKEVDLIESVLKPSGAEYSIIKKYLISNV